MLLLAVLLLVGNRSSQSRFNVIGSARRNVSASGKPTEAAGLARARVRVREIACLAAAVATAREIACLAVNLELHAAVAAATRMHYFDHFYRPGEVLPHEVLAIWKVRIPAASDRLKSLIPSLIALVRDGAPDVQGHVVRALANFSVRYELKAVIMHAGAHLHRSGPHLTQVRHDGPEGHAQRNAARARWLCAHHSRQRHPGAQEHVALALANLRLR